MTFWRDADALLMILFALQVYTHTHSLVTCKQFWISGLRERRSTTNLRGVSLCPSDKRTKWTELNRRDRETIVGSNILYSVQYCSIISKIGCAAQCSGVRCRNWNAERYSDKGSGLSDAFSSLGPFLHCILFLWLWLSRDPIHILDVCVWERECVCVCVSYNTHNFKEGSCTGRKLFSLSCDRTRTLYHVIVN